jgi:hypothetical protein
MCLKQMLPDVCSTVRHSCALSETVAFNLNIGERKKSFPRGDHCPLQRRSKTRCTAQTASFQIVTRGSQDVNMTTHLQSQTETKNAESHTSILHVMVLN